MWRALVNTAANLRILTHGVLYFLVCSIPAKYMSTNFILDFITLIFKEEYVL
jgi:hypothetical protein